jgi:hypothetical protein
MSEQDLDFVDGEAAPAPSSGERVPCRMRRSVGDAALARQEAHQRAKVPSPTGFSRMTLRARWLARTE